MDSEPFTLLFGKILDSSVWMLSKEARLVWITLLAMKDGEGVVRAAVNGLAHRANVEVEECRRALEIFLAPDPYSTSPAEEGRRLRVVAGGWQVINHEQYRFSSEAKRAYWREAKAAQRAKRLAAKANQGKGPIAREGRFVEALAAGQEKVADAIAAEGLPQPGPELVCEECGRVNPACGFLNKVNGGIICKECDAMLRQQEGNPAVSGPAPATPPTPPVSKAQTVTPPGRRVVTTAAGASPPHKPPAPGRASPPPGRDKSLNAGWETLQEGRRPAP